jgi:hypothetical protein
MSIAEAKPGELAYIAYFQITEIRNWLVQRFSQTYLYYDKIYMDLDTRLSHVRVRN